MRYTTRQIPRRVTGQGMTEYIIIVALIALAAVFAVAFFGDSVQAQFVSLGAEVLGEDGNQATQGVTAQIGEKVGEVDAESTLGTYND